MIYDTRGKFNEHNVVITFKVKNYKDWFCHSIYLISVYWMSYQIKIWINLKFNKIEQMLLNYSSKKYEYH